MLKLGIRNHGWRPKLLHRRMRQVPLHSTNTRRIFRQPATPLPIAPKLGLREVPQFRIIRIIRSRTDRVLSHTMSQGRLSRTNRRPIIRLNRNGLKPTAGIGQAFLKHLRWPRRLIIATCPQLALPGPRTGNILDPRQMQQAILLSPSRVYPMLPAMHCRA